MSEEIGKKTVLHLYAVFAVSVVLSFLPILSAAILGGVFFIGVMIAAYIVRGRAEDHSFLENHTTFLIRTIWISGLFGLVTFGLAIAYMIGSGIDYGVIEICVNDLISAKGTEWIASAGSAAVYEALAPCTDNFFDVNKGVFVNGALIGLGPIVVYIVFRLYRGMSRAVGGYRLAAPKAWF